MIYHFAKKRTMLKSTNKRTMLKTTNKRTLLKSTRFPPNPPYLKTFCFAMRNFITEKEVHQTLVVFETGSLFLLFCERKH